MATDSQQTPEDTATGARTNRRTRSTVPDQQARQLADHDAGQPPDQATGFDQTDAQQKRDDFRASGSPAPSPGNTTA